MLKQLRYILTFEMHSDLKMVAIYNLFMAWDLLIGPQDRNRHFMERITFEPLPWNFFKPLICGFSKLHLFLQILTDCAQTKKIICISVRYNSSFYCNCSFCCLMNLLRRTYEDYFLIVFILFEFCGMPS